MASLLVVAITVAAASLTAYYCIHQGALSRFGPIKSVKIVVFVPVSAADAVRLAMAAAGAGRIGNYDSCSFSSRGVGRFRPLEGAHPHIGKVAQLEAVEEERIEADCDVDQIEHVIAAIRSAHPYEEPGIDVYPLIHFTLPPK